MSSPIFGPEADGRCAWSVIVPEMHHAPRFKVSFLLSTLRASIFTWIRDEEHHPETLVRWDLEETDGVTTVRVTHSGLTSERLRTRHSGWPLILALLRPIWKSRLKSLRSTIKLPKDRI